MSTCTRLGALTSTLTLSLLALGAGPALAAGPKGPWVPVPRSDPYTLPLCGTQVTITEVANGERMRTSTAPDGTETTEVRGRYVVRYTAADGTSVTVNASGPGSTVVRPDGSLEIHLTGGSTVLAGGPRTRAALAAAGLPELFLSHGPVDLLFRVGGPDVASVTGSVRDLCAELT